MIRTWCRQQGHILGDVAFRDEGYSGTLPAPERPAPADALSEVEDGQAAGIVVGRPDRLARRLVTQEAILAQVWKSNGCVFTADQGEILQDDPEDLMRTAMRQMLGVFSELEHSMLVARLRAGRKEKAVQGGYAYGAPPYGWQAVAGELVEQPAEQIGLARARELQAAGAPVVSPGRPSSPGHVLGSPAGEEDVFWRPSLARPGSPAGEHR